MSCDEAEYKRQLAMIRGEPEVEPSEMPEDVKRASKTLMAALTRIEARTQPNPKIRRIPARI